MEGIIAPKLTCFRLVAPCCGVPFVSVPCGLATSTDLVADSRCARQVRLSHLWKLHLSFSQVKEAAAL